LTLIVRAASQRDVFDRRLATAREWLDMMKLEKRPRCTPLPTRAHERTLFTVARHHRTSDRRWDRAHAGLAGRRHRCRIHRSWLGRRRPINRREFALGDFLGQCFERQREDLLQASIRHSMPYGAR
jgi:hypothetical protein